MLIWQTRAIFRLSLLLSFLFSPPFPSDFFVCSIAWWTCQSPGWSPLSGNPRRCADRIIKNVERVDGVGTGLCCSSATDRRILWLDEVAGWSRLLGTTGGPVRVDVVIFPIQFPLGQKLLQLLVDVSWIWIKTLACCRTLGVMAVGIEQRKCTFDHNHENEWDDNLSLRFSYPKIMTSSSTNWSGSALATGKQTVTTLLERTMGESITMMSTSFAYFKSKGSEPNVIQTLLLSCRNLRRWLTVKKHFTDLPCHFDVGFVRWKHSNPYSHTAKLLQRHSVSVREKRKTDNLLQGNFIKCRKILILFQALGRQ